MQSQNGIAPINGTWMYYEVSGSGPPLVFVHAGIADSRMWDGQVAAFAADFTVVRYDLRGYGRTPMVAGPFAHRHDLAALLRYLGIDRAALVGCSMGGEMIVDFALEFPAMTTSLVPVASAVSGFINTSAPPAQRDALVAAYERGDLAQVSEYEVQIWVDGPQRGPNVVPAPIRDLVREMNLIPLAVPDDLGEEQPLEPPALDRLHTLAVPTLVIIGTLDQPRIVEQCELLAQRIPRAQRATLPTAHLPSMEQPEAFNRLVRAFLRE